MWGALQGRRPFKAKDAPQLLRSQVAILGRPEMGLIAGEYRLTEAKAAEVWGRLPTHPSKPLHEADFKAKIASVMPPL